MTHEVTPKVRLIAATALDLVEMNNYVSEIGGPAEFFEFSDPEDANMLVEFAGRVCYRSWVPGLNANVTRIRTDRSGYVENLLKQGHGSVFEHFSVSFLFQDVSRVFTHEIITHRVGTAKSQESLRYVRLDEDFGYWIPPEMDENDEAAALFMETMGYLGVVQARFARIFDLDNRNFDEKKRITSAMRRVAPIGLATTVLWTANLRTLRHCIEMRTHPAAEVEIRTVFDRVALMAERYWPGVFQDYTRTEERGIGVWDTPYRKV